MSFFETGAGAGSLTGDPPTCFNGGIFTARFAILVRKNDLPNVRGDFEAFVAKGSDGTTVKYGLSLSGEVKEGNFSPTDPDITKITWNTFVMFHSKGPGSAVACTGTGELTSETVVKGT